MGSPEGTVTRRGPAAGRRSSKAAVRERKIKNNPNPSKKQEVAEGNRRPSPHRRGGRGRCDMAGGGGREGGKEGKRGAGAMKRRWGSQSGIGAGGR